MAPTKFSMLLVMKDPLVSQTYFLEVADDLQGESAGWFVASSSVESSLGELDANLCLPILLDSIADLCRFNSFRF